MKSQSGFTLIEMVVVIIILGIMAATAMPRFTNLTGESRLAAVNGMAGGLSSASALARGKWFAAQSSTNPNADMGGLNVSVVAANNTFGSTASAVLGTPLALSAATGNTGILLALESFTGFSSAFQGTATSGIVFWPAGVAVSRTCLVGYRSGTVTTQFLGAIGSPSQVAGCL